MSVYALPCLVKPEALAGASAVVIDVLRMTSTAATALENGCAALSAAQDIDTARTRAREVNALLGGERGAVRISGFDFGNSPLEYTRARVEGKKLVLTTSNGTRAIGAAAGAKRVLLGCFNNLGALCDAVKGETDIALVCAGTNGAGSLDDFLAAGAIASRLKAAREDDMAIAARELYERNKLDPRALIRRAAHYKRLEQLGFEADLDYCINIDTINAVPELSSDGWFYNSYINK